MAMRFFKGSIWLSAVLSLGCFDGANGTSTGNGLTVQAVPSDSSALTEDGSIEVEDADGSPFEFSAMYAAIRDIDFKPAESDGCDDEQEGNDDCDDDKIRFSGPFAVNLLTGESEPALDDFAVPAGLYKQIDVRFDVNNSVSESLGPNGILNDAAFVIEGRDVEADLPFRVLIDLNIEAKFRSDEGIELEENNPKEVLLDLDPLGWLESISLHDCIEAGEFRTENGVVVIDTDGQNKCKTLEQDLRDKIKEENKLRMSTR